MSRISRIGLLAALAAIALLPLASFAAAPSTGIGVLDFQTLTKNYVGTKAANDCLQSLFQKLKSSLDVLQNGIGLNDDDFATYQKLKAQPAQDKAQIDKFEAQAKAAVQEFQGLEAKVQGKETLTAEQQARYDILKKQILSASARVNEQEQQAQETMNTEVQRLQDIVKTEINNAVAKIAKDQKLSIVLNKNVQMEQGVENVVVWNDQAMDVTDKVVKALNDNFKPELFDAKK
ncbi:MAG TPA: OmpH family outer membrane protein [Armatimonadota bacterium]|nr:OmpH family outer membrane protein [Armatimonadota bacterium]